MEILEHAHKDIKYTLPVAFKEALKSKFLEIYSPHPDFSKSHYVNRKEIDTKLAEYKQKMILQEKIIILVGPHGIGKSMSLNRCLTGERAIIHVTVDQYGSMVDDIGWLILTEGCSISASLVAHMSPLKIFEEACWEFKSVYGIIPNLVFDITPATSVNTASAIIRVAKRLVCDSKSCNVFITMSTSLVGLIPMGEKRVEFLYFPSFSFDEAQNYFDILEKDNHCPGMRRFSDEDLMLMNDKIGTNPYELKLIFQSNLMLQNIQKELTVDCITNIVSSLLEGREWSAGMLKIYRLLASRSKKEGSISYEVLNISKLTLPQIGSFIRTYEILDFIPAESRRSNFAGTFYFRNSVTYHSVNLFLTESAYNPIIQSLEKTEKNITINELDVIRNVSPEIEK